MARHAVFTIVQDDPVNLEIWVRHYRKTYPWRDCYVIHHPLPGEAFDSDWVAAILDPLRDGDRAFQLVPAFREESFNHAWLRETVQAFQRFLLQSYATVLFAEVDEIVVPDPLAVDVTFREWLDSFAAVGHWAVACTGYEIVHDYTCEPPLDFSRPLLAQRTYWYPSDLYSKPLLAKRPLTWVDGFHAVAPPARPLPGHSHQPARRHDLLLLHLHKLDYDTALARHQRSAARKWAQADWRERRGFQNRQADPDWLRDWWLNSVDPPYARAEWRRMPAPIKELL